MRENGPAQEVMVKWIHQSAKDAVLFVERALIHHGTRSCRRNLVPRACVAGWAELGHLQNDDHQNDDDQDSDDESDNPSVHFFLLDPRADPQLRSGR
jgi:hypothetical protein